MKGKRVSYPHYTMTPLKLSLNKNALERIASSLQTIDSNFDSRGFIETTAIELDELELKERVLHIIKHLHDYLPADFKETAKILSQIKKDWDHGDPEDPCRSFAAWPLIDYVGVYGLGHPDESLDCLAQITELFSAEFAVRPFIEKYPALCEARFKEWILSENEHLRRLASEGTRPRLPWGKQLKELKKDPRPSLPLLRLLLDDESLYVRKSVANHLNDISKDHPDLFISFAHENLLDQSVNRGWVLRHSARTLIKAGHPEIWPLIGCKNDVDVKAVSLSINKGNIKLGDSITFAFKAESGSESTQKLVIDYAVHFQSAKGMKRRKVFKLKTLELEAGEKISIDKAITFKPLSTRKLYSGEHSIDIMINGKVYQTETFELFI